MKSGFINLSNDSHELRLEFFEHGGHAGLRLKWSGPNVTKQIIPDSALTLIPYQEVKSADLIHHWSFSEGSGNTTNDSIGDADLTIEGATWVDCPTGKCLEFEPKCNSLRPWGKHLHFELSNIDKTDVNTGSRLRHRQPTSTAGKKTN